MKNARRGNPGRDGVNSTREQNEGGINAKIENLKKAAVIERVVARFVREGGWQTVCEKDATAWLDRSERDRRADVVAYVAEQYALAGVDSRGRKI